jgi:hypothetical protein
MMNTPTRRAVDRLAALEAIASGGGGGGGTVGTVATVTGGTTYSVKNSDTLIIFDSSNGTAPTADLPTTSLVPGQSVTFFWYNWNVAQVPPVIVAGGTNKVSPYTGMASAGSAGLVASTIITTTGGFITYKYNGAGAWLQAG